MELFYAYPENISGSRIILDDFEAQHLLKTLRKKTGDIVDITNGLGVHYRGSISSIRPELQVSVQWERIIAKDLQRVALAVSFIRPNRLEIILEKCTELGVTDFYLFRSTYANYFSDNSGRFEKILRQAMKQSNRFFLPQLHLLSAFDQLMEQTQHFSLKIAAIDTASPPIGTVIIDDHNRSILLCVGPEGGFSPGEITLLKEHNFTDVSLGKYRLRAETAAIAGISCLICR